MEMIVHDYDAKNFKLRIDGFLRATNHTIDFMTYLSTDQACGAKMLYEILRDLDEKDYDNWTVYGWFGDHRFGDDFYGSTDGYSTFINAAYFENENIMNHLWNDVPCLRISSCSTMFDDARQVCIGMCLSPYMRDDIMESMLIQKLAFENEDGGLFPGSDATLVAINENYIRKGAMHERPYELKFKMPMTYCVSFKDKDGKRKQTWRFITPADHKEMSDALAEMRRAERKAYDDEDGEEDGD